MVERNWAGETAASQPASARARPGQASAGCDRQGDREVRDNLLLAFYHKDTHRYDPPSTKHNECTGENLIFNISFFVIIETETKTILSSSFLNLGSRLNSPES